MSLGTAPTEDIETRAPDHPDVLRANNDLGDVLAHLGDFAASESHHSDALALADQHHDDESAAIALRGLCRARVRLGRSIEAVADCERALPLAAQVQRGEALRADLRAWLGRALIDGSLDGGHDLAHGQQQLAQAAPSCSPSGSGEPNGSSSSTRHERSPLTPRRTHHRP